MRRGCWASGRAIEFGRGRRARTGRPDRPPSSNRARNWERRRPAGSYAPIDQDRLEDAPARIANPDSPSRQGRHNIASEFIRSWTRCVRGSPGSPEVGHAAPGFPVPGRPSPRRRAIKIARYIAMSLAGHTPARPPAPTTAFCSQHDGGRSIACGSCCRHGSPVPPGTTQYSERIYSLVDAVRPRFARIARGWSCRHGPNEIEPAHGTGLARG